jgi:hypothetical protein
MENKMLRHINVKALTGFWAALLVASVLLFIPTQEAAAACRGAWAEGVNYAAGDTVTYNGSVYTARVAHGCNGCGWNPIAAPSLWALGGTCSGGTNPTPTPTPTTAPTPIGSGPVCFFQHTNFTGTSFCSNEGSFNAPAGWSDFVSSVRVQAGFRVDLFADANQTGTLLSLTADEPNLVNRSFNDVMSSYRVVRAGTPTPTPTPAPGSAVTPAPNSAQYNPKCSPPVNIVVEDPAGLQPFSSRFNMANLPATFQQIGRNVCAVLYKNAAEVQANQTSVTLTFRNMAGVAFNSGGNIVVSTQHVQNVANSGQDVVREILGVLSHEVTHTYQYNDADGSPRAPQLGGVIEGVADYVRFRHGFKTYANRRKGGTWSAGYDTTAFFIDYLDRTYFDFGYRFNQSMSSRDGRAWNSTVFQTLTGKSVDTLWNEYQVSF